MNRTLLFKKPVYVADSSLFWRYVTHIKMRVDRSGKVTLDMFGHNDRFKGAVIFNWEDLEQLIEDFKKEHNG